VSKLLAEKRKILLRKRHSEAQDGNRRSRGLRHRLPRKLRIVSALREKKHRSGYRLGNITHYRGEENQGTRLWPLKGEESASAYKRAGSRGGGVKFGK